MNTPYALTPSLATLSLREVFALRHATADADRIPVPFSDIGKMTKGLLSTKAYPVLLGPGAHAWPSCDASDPFKLKLGVALRHPWISVESHAARRPHSAPALSVAAATRCSNLLLGGKATYSYATQALSKSTISAGFHGADYQVVADYRIVAAQTDIAQTLRLAFVHALSPRETVGAEVVHHVRDAGDDGALSAPAFAVGYARRLSSGDVLRCRLDNCGALAVGYTTVLPGGEAVGLVVQGSTADLSQPLKYGLSVSLDGRRWPWAR